MEEIHVNEGYSCSRLNDKKRPLEDNFLIDIFRGEFPSGKRKNEKKKMPNMYSINRLFERGERSMVAKEFGVSTWKISSIIRGEIEDTEFHRKIAYRLIEVVSRGQDSLHNELLNEFFGDS